MTVPSRPAPVDSSDMIDDLNKALKALGATTYEYDGHREKAIEHIGAAIRRLGLPGAQGASNAAVSKAMNGQDSAKTRTKSAGTAAPSGPDDASNTQIRKALTALFSVHHKLTKKTSSVGQIQADAQVRIAIDELVAARNMAAPAASPASGATSPSSSPSTAAGPSPRPVPKPASNGGK